MGIKTGDNVVMIGTEYASVAEPGAGAVLRIPLCTPLADHRDPCLG